MGRATEELRNDLNKLRAALGNMQEVLEHNTGVFQRRLTRVEFECTVLRDTVRALAGEEALEVALARVHLASCIVEWATAMRNTYAHLYVDHVEPAAVDTEYYSAATGLTATEGGSAHIILGT